MMKIVGIVAAIIAAGLIAYYAVPRSIYGPEPNIYQAYLRQESESSDKILASGTCGSYELQITEYDKAEKGLSALGYYRSPRLLRWVSIDGFKSGKKVFSTGDREHGEMIADVNQENGVQWPIVSIDSGFSYSHQPTIFVIDAEEFKGVNQFKQPRSNILIFNSYHRIPAEDVEAFASCYASNAKEFNDIAVTAPSISGRIAAFLLTDASHESSTKSWEEFDCNGQRVTVSETAVKLIKQVDGIDKGEDVGTVSAEGDFRPTTSAILWTSCRTGEGKTFQEYIDQRKDKVKYLEA